MGTTKGGCIRARYGIKIPWWALETSQFEKPESGGKRHSHPMSTSHILALYLHNGKMNVCSFF